MTKIDFSTVWEPIYEDDYDGMGGVTNPYETSVGEYECPHNCRDMSTHNFLLYSLMVCALGFFVGITVGIFI